MKIVILLLVFTFSVAVKLPPNLQKCNRKDKATLDDCIFKAARDAIVQITRPYEELNIPELNPFKFSESYIDGGNGPVAVSQRFKNCNIYGLTTLQLDKFLFDFDKKTLAVKGTFLEIRLECDYEVKGKVLLFPVNGVGNSTIILKKLKIAALFHYGETKRRGKTHIKFTTGDVTMDPELVTFDFLNHVDKRLSDHLNPVLNENWKEIFSDVKGSYLELVKQIVLQLLNGFFGKVSLEEALDD